MADFHPTVPARVEPAPHPADAFLAALLDPATGGPHIAETAPPAVWAALRALPVCPSNTSPDEVSDAR